MKLTLPLLVTADKVCAKLHISPRTLGRWEVRGIIPFHVVGKAHRYLSSEVEAAFRKCRFGAPLPPDTRNGELRERVSANVIFSWLASSRATLARRMQDGTLPFYRVGQTYRFAPDEVGYSLGIPLLEQTEGMDVFPGGLS